MNDSSSTIAITTDDNEVTILYTLERLNFLTKKHSNIKKIIIIDNNSKDKTVEIILKYMSHKDKKNLITLFCMKNKTNERNRIKKILQNTISTNIIFIEPEMYTFPRQITTIISKLIKVEAIIPTRFHNEGIVMFKNQKEKNKIEKENNKIQKKHLIKIKDPTIKIKAFRTQSLRQISNNIKKTNNFWIQIYQQLEKNNTRITQMKIEQNCIRKNNIYNPEKFLKN